MSLAMPNCPAQTVTWLNNSHHECHNSNLSASREDTGDKGSMRRRVAYLIFFLASLMLATFVIISNILFILACRKTRALRTIANKHVHSLAVADMIIGIAIYTQGAFYINIDKGNLHSIRFLCLSLMSMTSIGLTSSLLSVMLIAIDRYIYIVLPYRYTYLVTARRTNVAIVVAWTLSLAYGTVPMYNNKFNHEKGCGPSESTDTAYATSRLVMFVVACSISGFCHISIQCTAIRHIKRLYPTKYHNMKRSLTSEVQHMTRAHKYMLSSLKPIKSFFLVYVLFVYSWTPGLIIYVLGSSHRVLLIVFAIMAELSTGLNVIVYVLSNRQFKVAIMKIVNRSSSSIFSSRSQSNSRI